MTGHVRFYRACLLSGSLARADLDPSEQSVDGGELAPAVLVRSRHQRHELGDLSLRGVALLSTGAGLERRVRRRLAAVAQRRRHLDDDNLSARW